MLSIVHESIVTLVEEEEVKVAVVGGGGAVSRREGRSPRKRAIVRMRNKKHRHSARERTNLVKVRSRAGMANDVPAWELLSSNCANFNP